MFVFQYRRSINFYETDMMGVVHHSRHLLYFEEARTAWLKERGLGSHHGQKADCYFSVVESGVSYLRPLRFNDDIVVEIYAQSKGVKIRFNYIIKVLGFDSKVAQGYTIHVPVNGQMKVIKLNSRVKEVLEKEAWIEI